MQLRACLYALTVDDMIKGNMQRGFFHQWGTEVEDGDGVNCVPRTVAIVESIKGFVAVVRPQLIQFTEVYDGN